MIMDMAMTSTMTGSTKAEKIATRNIKKEKINGKVSDRSEPELTL